MSRLAAAVLALLLMPAARAAMVEEPVEWSVGKDRFSGVLVYDDAVATKRPGLLMVPDWRGITPPNVAKARDIAGRDYVVLVADMYGKGVRPKDDAEARELVTRLYADPGTLRARATRALEVLRAQAGKAPMDTARMAAFGYCFGGSTVLELARSGADLAGVVSFHGGLSTSLPAAPGTLKASVLVLNGADDKGTAGDIAGFEKEMNAAGADWQFVNFSGAVHCFALPHANRPGCMYNPRAATRSERMMRDFLVERFSVAR
ncbi:dienelactone hydrolase family protein [Aerolutibacter ruishenii]|uniref:Dienelactone hydrolase n=1 Tax=Aerolutibacter ruishenii TaxID=686800 RepID=A0A562LPH0_9GAMM|nr:dienelactone hydrolase family protein [Lysobacter ruishenii]TWI09524.1 dienelactone hydrolase [Lysobacter ruishenii]